MHGPGHTRIGGVRGGVDALRFSVYQGLLFSLRGYYYKQISQASVNDRSKYLLLLVLAAF